MKKCALIGAMTIALMSASAANAELFTYVDSKGNTMKIDTVAKTGSISGPLINASFYGTDLANFAGGATPTGHYNINFNAGSTATAGYQYGTGTYIAPNGTTYLPNNSHQPMLEFNGTNAFNVWAVWGTASNPNAMILGDYYWSNSGYTPPAGTSTSSGGSCSTGGCASTTGGTTTSGGTTTGGTTTSGGTTSGGSTGGSTGGGTPVPAPGILGLVALAGIGIGAARRRRK